jgi:hypothetical protein
MNAVWIVLGILITGNNSVNNIKNRLIKEFQPSSFHEINFTRKKKNMLVSCMTRDKPVNSRTRNEENETAARYFLLFSSSANNYCADV